jgi:hypothetical protein
MLLARLQQASPHHANRANRLLTVGCDKAIVKGIMAIGDAHLREGRLAEEEEKRHLEPLADSPLSL